MSPSIAAADTVEATEVRLSNEEASIVAAEAAAAAEVLSEPERSAALALARYAETGSVPAASIGTLEQVVATSLAGGRARRRYTAEGEKQLGAVFDRTPRGLAHRASIAEVNRALAALAGRSLRGVRVGTRIPGSHTVAIEADGVTVTLGLTAAGVTVESVAL